MKYLQERDGRYYFYRRVPTDLVGQVGGTFTRQSLQTDDLSIACERLKAANAATERYWAELRSMGTESKAAARYEAARALPGGFDR